MAFMQPRHASGHMKPNVEQNMELAINPLILVACLIGFAAIIAGILFIIRLLSGSTTWKTPTVLSIFAIGLAVYCGALYLGTKLNPRDFVDGSWTDPYLGVTTILGFLICVVTPFRLDIPISAHIGVTVFNFLILAAAFWTWFSLTA